MVWKGLLIMEVVHAPCAGLDISKRDAKVCIRIASKGRPGTQQYVDEALLVDDAAIREAQRVLWEELRVFAEPGRGTALAALLSGAFPTASGTMVGVVVCGTNLDPASWSGLPEAGV